jgi:hypothetical protein
MKKLILLGCFLSILVTAMGQIVSSTPVIEDDDLLSVYKNDADWITLEWLSKANLPEKDSICIPQGKSDTILNALLSVHNALSLAARDTVVNRYNIHVFDYYSMNYYTICPFQKQDWVVQLANRNVPCGQPEIDSLMQKYRFYFDSYEEHKWSRDYYLIKIKSNINYNYAPLKAAFEKISDVDFLEPALGRIGDGNTITGAIYPDYVLLNYSVGWGDCLAGCIARRFWHFKVYYDYSVEYAGSSGADFPWTSINEINPDLNDITVFPNPVKDRLYIRNMTPPFEYSIIDITGKIIVSGHATHDQIEIPERLNRGEIYLLRLKGEKQSKVFKITK